MHDFYARWQLKPKFHFSMLFKCYHAISGSLKRGAKKGFYKVVTKFHNDLPVFLAQPCIFWYYPVPFPLTGKLFSAEGDCFINLFPARCCSCYGENIYGRDIGCKKIDGCMSSFISNNVPVPVDGRTQILDT